MKNFALTGVAGYIAPRHLKAIKDTGNELIAALDPYDSVGIMDQYFPNAGFFTEFERFDRHLEMLRRKHDEYHLDYLSICSPNHLHDAHIRLALRLGADAICENPLVLNPWNLDSIQKLEEETGKKVYNILQIRDHPSIVDLKNKIKPHNGRKHNVILTYIAPRGLWYKYSWKGDITKSGGIATNIGIHFFDLLIWLFGNIETGEVYLSQPDKMSGLLSFPNANVRWYLSLDSGDLPEIISQKKQTTYSSILIDGEELEFSSDSLNLHTKVYENILAGKGYGIEDTRAAIELVYGIRSAKLTENSEYIHPFTEQKINKNELTYI